MNERGTNGRKDVKERSRERGERMKGKDGKD